MNKRMKVIEPNFSVVDAWAGPSQNPVLIDY
jgi:hypothetical protein